MQLWRPEIELDGISLDTRKFVFSNRVVDNWNSLSAQCVNSCTINTFKKHVSV